MTDGTETGTSSYDPVPDLAKLLCTAQRQPSPLGGLTVPLERLREALDLPWLPYPDEAEAALRKALAPGASGGEDPEPGTAGWLHDQLSSQPRDRKIIMARDAEGNGYSPLAGIEEGMYSATSTWSGEIYGTPEDVAAEPGEWTPAPDDAERVIVLGPVN